jgi:hypothetical protein
MQLTDFARKVPEEVWTLFAPLLPPVVWCGNGCPPYDNRACLHAVLYVLVIKSPNSCKQVRQQTRHSDGVSSPPLPGAPARSGRRAGAGAANCGSVVVQIH